MRWQGCPRHRPALAHPDLAWPDLTWAKSLPTSLPLSLNHFEKRLCALTSTSDPHRYLQAAPRHNVQWVGQDPKSGLFRFHLTLMEWRIESSQGVGHLPVA